MPRLITSAFTFLAGYLMAYGFADFTGAFLLYFGFATLGFCLVTRSPRPFLSGWIFGFGYFLNLIDWIDVIGIDAWIALSLISSFWWGLGFIFAARFSSSRFPAFTAGIWFTTFELIRDRFPWGGFGWGQFGFIAIETPFLNSLIPYLGQVFLTLLIATALFSIAKRQLRFRALFISSISIVTLSFVLPSFAATAQTGSDTILGVQGGVVYHPLGEVGVSGEVFAKHLEITLQNLSQIQSADLIVWPESAVDRDFSIHPEMTTQILNLQKTIDKPLLINSVTEVSTSEIANRSYLVSASGIQDVYQKQRLVPFGEFMPLRPVIEKFTERAALMPRDFVPGTENSPKFLNDLGLVVCFEIADDQIPLNQGPVRALIVQTNNATYQAGNQSNQQLLMTRFRAAELAVPTLTIATSGISAAIGPEGEILAALDKSDRGVVSIEAPSATVSTPARHISQVIPWAIWGLAVISMLGRIKVKA